MRSLCKDFDGRVEFLSSSELRSEKKERETTTTRATAKGMRSARLSLFLSRSGMRDAYRERYAEFIIGVQAGDIVSFCLCVCGRVVVRSWLFL